MTALALPPDHAGIDPDPARESPAGEQIGATRLAVSAFMLALGLMIVAWADALARAGHTGASYPLLWLGLVTMFAPAVAHAWRGCGRTESLLLVVLLGTALYMVKVLDTPLHFTFHDEFSTLRATQDIQRYGQPFHHDPLITIHPYFPGLQLVTDALATVTGMSLFLSAMVLIGVMRVVMMVALFLLFERAASTRVAALGAVLYAANPNFVFFDAQWAYESFSLPLALAAVALAARAPWSQWDTRIREVRGRTSWRAFLITLLVVLTVLVSHPITSYALILFLLVWAAIDTVMARRAKITASPELWLLGLVALALTGVWTAVFGTTAGRYFAPLLSKATSAGLNLLLGESAPKQLFHAAGVPVTPLIERLIGFASVGLALLVLPLGLIALRRHLTPLRATLALAAVLYVPTLPLRLTQAGTEISNRASEFVYVGIAFLAAIVLTADWRWRPRRSRRTRLGAAAIAIGAATVAFMGGIVIGWARYSRIPGPYLVVADERSVDPEGIAAARWTAGHLGTQNRILVDRPNGLLMGSLGDQDPQTGALLGRPLPTVLLGPEFTPTTYYVLAGDRLSYVVVDTRLADALPLVGVYVENDEPDAYAHTRPPTVAGLLKFNGICPIGRVFDSGNISIFDTRSLTQDYCPVAATRPRHYSWFATGPFKVWSRVLDERAVVGQFDLLRQDPAANAARLAALRVDLRFLQDRLWRVAHTKRQGGWQVYHRYWRWQELDNRLLQITSGDTRHPIDRGK